MMRIDMNNRIPIAPYANGQFGIGQDDRQVRAQEVRELQPDREVANVEAQAVAPAKEEVFQPAQRGNQDPREAAVQLWANGTPADLLGSGAGVHTSDMERAISDMHKDDILQEYQYFVGSANDVTGANAGDVAYSDEDGTVRRIS